MSSASIDPTTVSVIANRLETITNEMGETMLRTSRSPVFSEARDFATAVFDHDGRWVANKGYIPNMAGSLPFAQQSIVDAFGDDIHDGDVFIMNDPYNGGTHLPDASIIRPVYEDDELRFWMVVKGHQADIGGQGVMGHNPEAETIWDEGIRIPPMKLYSEGDRRTETWEMILRNVKIRELVEGDLECMVGATVVGERESLNLTQDYDYHTEITPAVAELLDSSEERMRKAIEEIPDGSYSARRAIGDDGIDKDELVYVALTIEVDGDELTYDFTDSDDQATGFINLPYPATVSAALTPLWYFTDPDMRRNDGSLRPLHFETRKGSVVDVEPPGPVCASSIHSNGTIHEAGLVCLNQALPGEGPAPWADWFAPASTGLNPRTHRPFAEIHFFAKGGGGATEGLDGWDHIGLPACSGALRTPDPELHEMAAPYRLEHFEYRQDSGGPGQWRGGLGVVYRWKVLADHIPAAMFGKGTREETVPIGFAGGEAPPLQFGRIVKEDGTEIEMDANGMHMFEEGDTIEIHATGGGGYGEPFERDLEKVREDVRNGVVSVEAAREDYGVVIDPESLEVDTAATEELRS